MTQIERPRSARRSAGSAVRTLTVALMIGAAVTGCGDDGSHNATPDAPSGGSDSGSAPPAVLVAERVFSPNARSYFVSVLPDVPTAAIDRTKAIELTSADIEVFDGKVFIRDRVANTMTRYAVSSELELVEEDKLSFATTGIAANRFSSVYLAPERAYLMDSTGWNLIGWNPSTMTLTGENISILGMSHSEFTGSTGQISPAVKVGDRYLAAVYWENFATSTIYPGSGVIVIDPTQATLAPTLIEDPRLGGGFRVAAEGDDAYLMGVTDGAARLLNRVYNGGAMPASGMLKLAAGASAFDAAYQIDLEAITKAPFAWAIHRLSATRLLVQIYDPADAPPKDTTEYASSTNFIFGVIDTEAKTFTAIPTTTLPKGGRANAGNYVIDGKVYIQLSNDTGSQAYAVATDGTITPAFPVPAGDVWHLARIR